MTQIHFLHIDYFDMRIANLNEFAVFFLFSFMSVCMHACNFNTLDPSQIANCLLR